MKIGIIDLGTNTFNILIIELGAGQSFEKLLNTESAVMLGSEGINDGYISDRAFARAYGILRNFKQMLEEFKCDKVVAFGTSAIRTATNSDDFISKIKKDFNINIEPISGEQEAEYIYKGVSQVISFTSENYLILDIGGGSNEFIIANNQGVKWIHSFKLGSARLLARFQPSNPILLKEIKEINSYLQKELKYLFEAIVEFPVTKLIGSSGAFDSFAEILQHKKKQEPILPSQLSNKISLSEYNDIHQTLISSDKEARSLIPGLEAIRVETIVMASIFTTFVINNTIINELIQSAYSLKEGVAIELDNKI